MKEQLTDTITISLSLSISFTVYNLTEVTEESSLSHLFSFSQLCDSSKSSAQFRSDIFLPGFFFSFLSLGCLHGGALGSDALPHATQEMHQCLMAHRLLLRYCVCVMLLSLGSALVGMSLMFYSGVRQVKVSPGHHPCNSPGWNIRVTKPLAPHGGSETGKHADWMAIPALYPCPCQAETVREVAGRGGADVFIFIGVARKPQMCPSLLRGVDIFILLEPSDSCFSLYFISSLVTTTTATKQNEWKWRVFSSLVQKEEIGDG